MPSTRIDTRAGWIGTRHEALIAAVQSALIAAIHIPENDRTIRIMEYPDTGFAMRPGAGPRYTIVEIAMFSGRSIDAKRRLYAALAEAFATFGVPAEDLMIIVHDLPRENWSTNGVALCDVDLGFKVEV